MLGPRPVKMFRPGGGPAVLGPRPVRMFRLGGVWAQGELFVANDDNMRHGAVTSRPAAVSLSSKPVKGA